MQEALTQVKAPPPPKKDIYLAEICDMQQLYLYRICNIDRIYKQPKIWKTIDPITKEKARAEIEITCLRKARELMYKAPHILMWCRA